MANKSLETSRALLNQTQAQYEVGVVSRVEVTEAEAGVAQREFDQIFAENRYRDAQDELIDRVYGPRLTPNSRVEIEPTDRPEDFVSFALDAEASTARALERRPDLRIAQQQAEQSEILVKFAKNERLPQVDLVGSYGTHGLSGNDPNCSFSAALAGTCPVPNPPTQPVGHRDRLRRQRRLLVRRQRQSRLGGRRRALGARSRTPRPARTSARASSSCAARSPT